jgi:hypothetical protein
MSYLDPHRNRPCKKERVLMAFGQASGPPASAKQLAYLASLLKDAGYETFREARHPFGLTQRQASGKFTTREASHLIDRLLGNVEEPDPDAIDADQEMQLELGDGPDPFASGTIGSGAGPAGSKDARKAAAAAARAAKAEARLAAQRESLIASIPADDLVAELERRGWRCTPPPA